MSDSAMANDSMNLTSHLVELKLRLIHSLICLFAVFAVCYGLADTLLGFVLDPLRNQLNADIPMVFISLPEVFFAQLKISFVFALFIASPYMLYHLWSFIAPGLYKGERDFFLLFLVGSSVLFMLGGYFSYSVVMPMAFGFFLGFASPGLDVMPAVQPYVSLVMTLAFVFGLAFEIPLVCIILVKLGVMSTAAMKKQRRWVFVGAFVLGAILTPPDIISQVMLAVPVYLLFEVGVFIARRFERAEED
ncbi:MAG: twin-arginine translocase subunit TatC [Mariprofundus sp.]